MINAEIMNEIMRDGKVTHIEKFVGEDGMRINQFTIEYNDEEYLMTSINGEWAYFHRTIR